MESLEENLNTIIAKSKPNFLKKKPGFWCTTYLEIGEIKITTIQIFKIFQDLYLSSYNQFYRINMIIIPRDLSFESKIKLMIK